MSKNKEIRELTKSQIEMVDEVDRLLLKLRKSGVKPINIIGESGGLVFARCSQKGMEAITEAVLNNTLIDIENDKLKIEDFVYAPKNSAKSYVMTILL